MGTQNSRAKGPAVQRKPLKQRDYEVDLESRLGKTQVVTPVAPLSQQLCGGKTSEGVFVGAFLSMSSTAVVLKFLMERNSINALHGQVTVGTLILQDCAVGLLFALLPVLGGTSGIFQGVLSMAKS